MKQKNDLVTVKSYRKEDAVDGYVGQNCKTFVVTLDKILKPYDTITICKAFGDYLMVEEVDGFEHTMSILYCDKYDKYPTKLLNNSYYYFIASNTYINEVVGKLKVENKFNNNEHREHTTQE